MSQMSSKVTPSFWFPAVCISASPFSSKPPKFNPWPLNGVTEHIDMQVTCSLACSQINKSNTLFCFDYLYKGFLLCSFLEVNKITPR